MLVSEVPLFERCWYAISRVDALVDGPVARRLLGVDLVIWRRPDGVVSAARDRCPHREARLSAGTVDELGLTCPYHGWVYGDGGQCVHIPQLEPDTPIPSRARLDTVLATERYGLVWACLSDQPAGGIPDVPEYDDGAHRAIFEPETLWPASAPVLLDNNFDLAHIAWVHQSSFGQSGAPAPVAEIVRTPTGLCSFTKLQVSAEHGKDRPSTRTTEGSFVAPFTGVFRMVYESGVTHVMVKCITPIDDATSRQLQLVLRTDREEDVPAEKIIAFDLEVTAEDQRQLADVPANYRTELSDLVHLKVDKASIELRRLYGEIEAGTWEPQPH
jgi:phenylpropionate dioxygenase-like ring-hydroxylating dioxygenase large terminal subunit